MLDFKRSQHKVCFCNEMLKPCSTVRSEGPQDASQKRPKCASNGSGYGRCYVYVGQNQQKYKKMQKNQKNVKTANQNQKIPKNKKNEKYRFLHLREVGVPSRNIVHGRGVGSKSRIRVTRIVGSSCAQSACEK